MCNFYYHHFIFTNLHQYIASQQQTQYSEDHNHTEEHSKLYDVDDIGAIRNDGKTSTG
jgi:hypothetical protein